MNLNNPRQFWGIHCFFFVELVGRELDGMQRFVTPTQVLLGGQRHERRDFIGQNKVALAS